MKATKYRCPHCHLFVWRKSTKAWIKSWCDRTGRSVRLQIIRNG